MIPPADDELALGHVNLGVASERESPAINWMRSFIDRRLERDKIRFICVAILALNLSLAAIFFATFDGTRTVFGPPPCTDFAGFYTAGRILRAYSPSRVYDLELQDRVYHEVLPELPLHTKLPFVYPPFFSLIFEPLAALPYTQACLLWMVLSALLYLVGLAALWGTRQAIPAGEWPMAFLLAFSFQPFLECWLSGQTSVFGFAAMAWALRCESLGRSFRAGLLISFCLYKPPLLVLIVPLLIVARRWRILLGFITGAAGLAGISLLTFGWHGFLRTPTGFGVFPVNQLEHCRYPEVEIHRSEQLLELALRRADSGQCGLVGGRCAGGNPMVGPWMVGLRPVRSGPKDVTLGHGPHVDARFEHLRGSLRCDPRNHRGRHDR